nr:MAG TPA: hypothetical protein [Bacteriophage sp.]
MVAKKLGTLEHLGSLHNLQSHLLTYYYLLVLELNLKNLLLNLEYLRLVV